MKKRFAIFTGALLTAMSVAGCAGGGGGGEATTGSNGGSEGGAEKVVTVAISSDGAMDKLDAATYNGPHPIYLMIYDGLTWDEGATVAPLLAESWDISDDGKTYTFKLKENVKFSDGTDFDAEAVEFNMKRWVNNKDHESVTASMVEKMEVVDKNTIKITYKTASNAILKELTYPRPTRILSPASITMDTGDDFGTFTKPVGSGQWMLDSYKENQEFTLVPNPEYWGEKPKVDKIVFKVIPDGEARTMALQSGEVDIIGGDLIGKLSTESYNTLKNDSRFKTYEVNSIVSYFLAFNQDVDWFKDLKVRQAINMAINKEAMVNDLMGGLGTPAKSVFAPGSQYYNDSDISGYSYNLEEAKKLLSEAGLTDSDNDGILEKDGKPFEISLLLTPDQVPEWKTIGEFTQSELSKLGIKVNLNTVDENAYDDMRDKREFDLCVRRTSSDSWMPHGVIQDLFGVENPMMQAWIDPELVSLVQKTLVSQGDDIQKNYSEIFNMIYENAYAVPLYIPVTTYATSEKVTTFKPIANAYAAIDWGSLEISE